MSAEPEKLPSTHVSFTFSQRFTMDSSAVRSREKVFKPILKRLPENVKPESEKNCPSQQKNETS